MGEDEEKEEEEGQGREDGTCNRELQMGIFSAVTFKKTKKKMLKKWRYVTANLSLNGREEHHDLLLLVEPLRREEQEQQEE